MEVDKKVFQVHNNNDKTNIIKGVCLPEGSNCAIKSTAYYPLVQLNIHL